jgi:FkbM family methyltransferase
MGMLFESPKQEDLIYDVGAHKGEDTAFYLRKGFRVVAIEANPELVVYCQDRFKEFIDRGRLTLIEGAVIDLASLVKGSNKIPFYKNDCVSIWGTICADWAARNLKKGHPSSIIEVHPIDFVDVVREHGVPHYMKIDIEGCDMICLDALKKFRERPSYVSIESDKTSFNKVRHEIDTLTELGYDAFQAVEQSYINLNQTPPYPAKEGAYVDWTFEVGATGLFGAELGDRWKSKQVVLRQYRGIRMGYYLLGDDGIMKPWTFRGAGRLRTLTRHLVSLLTKATVPGWYDTHARLAHIRCSR